MGNKITPSVGSLDGRDEGSPSMMAVIRYKPIRNTKEQILLMVK